MLTGKTVVLGVTGSIAAYKIANLASALVKLHADVHVIMTRNATNFINPIAFETLTKNKCMVETFDRQFQYNVAHVSLADKADVLLVAPASANIIAKMAHGIADDMLSTTYLAMKCPVIVSPAMNVHMFTNPVVQRNIETLGGFGVTVIPPDNGYLACGYTGAGKMPSEQVLLDYILRAVAKEKDWAGKRVLVTAGPTRESTVARQAMLRGAEVTLVSGPVSIAPPPFVTVVPVQSAQDMFEAVQARFADADVIIKTAAVADYTPVQTAEQKIKKSADGADLSIPLRRTADILQWLGAHKREGQVLCGFSMETENMVENSRAKLQKKNADLIAANSLRDEGSGFGTDTNHLVLIKRDGVTDLPLLSKSDAADRLLDELLTMCR